MIARLLALTPDAASRSVVPFVEVDLVAIRMLAEAHMSDSREALIAHHFGLTEVDGTIQEGLRYLSHRDRTEQVTRRGKDIRIPPATLLLTEAIVLGSENLRHVIGACHDDAAAATKGHLQTEVLAQDRVDPLERARAKRELLGRLVHELGLGGNHTLDPPPREGEDREWIGHELESLVDTTLDLGELTAQETRDRLEHRHHLQEARSRNRLHPLVVRLDGDLLDHVPRDFGVLAREDFDVLRQIVTPDSPLHAAILTEDDGMVILLGHGQGIHCTDSF